MKAYGGEIMMAYVSEFGLANGGNGEYTSTSKLSVNPAFML